jgi:DNA-binding response OmpR family regulator
MAEILIVEDDGLAAGLMARTLRQAGHTPILARDGRSALEEAEYNPDVVLLDLGLPDLPGEEVLRRLKSRPRTADIPVVVVTGRSEAARQLEAAGTNGVADILLKPVSGAQLRQAVDGALAGQDEPDADTLRQTQERQRKLIQRLIVEGSDALVFHTSRRLSLDRTRGRGARGREAMTWGQIAEWASCEGLVDAEQAGLLRRIHLSRPPERRRGWA